MSGEFGEKVEKSELYTGNGEEVRSEMEMIGF